MSDTPTVPTPEEDEPNPWLESLPLTEAAVAAQVGMSKTPETDAAAHGFCQANPQKTALDTWGIECVDSCICKTR